MKQANLLMVGVAFALLSFGGIGVAAETPSETKMLCSVPAGVGSPAVKLTIRKELRADGIYLAAVDAAGKQVWESANLGSEDKKFVIDKQASTLIAKDLTGDGSPEVITAAYYGPGSGLYVYTWDAKAAKFAPIPCVYPKNPDANREYLVADIPQENGEDMLFQSDSNVRIMGKIYPEKETESVVDGFYYFELKNGTFTFLKQEKIPGQKGK